MATTLIAPRKSTATASEGSARQRPLIACTFGNKPFPYGRKHRR
jgi:hypothetical protein